MNKNSKNRTVEEGKSNVGRLEVKRGIDTTVNHGNWFTKSVASVKS